MTSREVDQYIDGAAPYARPILQRIRAAFHRACPEVTETLKWGKPFFGWQGKILAVMGAFKSHVRFRFWNAEALPDPHKLFAGKQEDGEEGALKLESVADLPSDEVLEAYIKQAMRLQASGVKAAPRAAKPPKPKLTPPEDFLASLKVHPPAAKAFEALSPSHRREYVEWILEAKREATRLQRISIATEWLGEGKSLHWKYERKGVA